MDRFIVLHFRGVSIFNTAAEAAAFIERLEVGHALIMDRTGSLHLFLTMLLHAQEAVQQGLEAELKADEFENEDEEFESSTDGE